MMNSTKNPAPEPNQIGAHNDPPPPSSGVTTHTEYLPPGWVIDRSYGLASTYFEIQCLGAFMACGSSKDWSIGAYASANPDLRRQVDAVLARFVKGRADALRRQAVEYALKYDEKLKAREVAALKALADVKRGIAK